MARVRPATQNILSYVWLQNLAGDVQPRYLSGGFLGSACSPLRVGTDLNNPANPTFRFTGFDPPPDIQRERLRNRWALLESVDAVSGRNVCPTTANMRNFQERAVDLVTGPDAGRAGPLRQ